MIMSKDKDDGVLSILDSLRDNVRDYDYIYEQLVECERG